MNRKAFAIISTALSGSTLIRKALDSHPQIVCAGEIFHSKQSADSFHQYILDLGLSRWEVLPRKKKLVYRFLDKFYEDAEKDIKGFKFMYSQAIWRPYRFPMVMDYLKKQSIPIIHIVRENSLHVFISRAMARRTGIWHSERGRQPDSVIEIPVAQALRSVKKIERKKALWRRRLASYKVLEVKYDDFVDDRESAAKSMLEFLGANPDIQLSCPMRKVIRAPYEHVVSNYSELKEAFSEAGYSRFVD